VERVRKLLSIALSLVIVATFSGIPAWAEDEVGVAVEVVSTEGAPEIMVETFVPFGKKSDAAITKYIITGLEPNRDVFFVITPFIDAFARATSDENGNLKAKLELPYGLEPGMHEIVARTFFSSDDIPTSYTIGQLFVSDFGVLTKSDGTSPTGTERSEVLLQYSNQKFKTAPLFPSPRGTLRVSEPQLRTTQSWLPSLGLGLSFNNDTNAVVGFSAKTTLETFFGTKVGETYFSDFPALAPGETQTVLLTFDNLPPIGLFNIRTELQLPNDFAASSPIQTTVSNVVFVAPITFWSLSGLVLLAGIFVQRRLRKTKLSQKLRMGVLA